MKVQGVREGIEYGLMGTDTLAGAIDCVSDVFTGREPLTVHLGITKDEFVHFANAVYPVLAEQGLSFVARDKKSGAVVGVRISEDFAGGDEDEEIPGLSPKFYPIFSLLGQLSDRYKKEHHVEPGRFIHLFMVAVRHGYTERGIAPTMNRYFFKHVMNLGYQKAVTEPTGAISQHVLINKFGFSPVYTLDYDDFEFEEKKIFAGIKDHRCAMLLEKDLSMLDLDAP